MRTGSGARRRRAVRSQLRGPGRPALVLRTLGARVAGCASARASSSRRLALDLRGRPAHAASRSAGFTSSATSRAATSRRNRALRALPDRGRGSCVSDRRRVRRNPGRPAGRTAGPGRARSAPVPRWTRPPRGRVAGARGTLHDVARPERGDARSRRRPGAPGRAPCGRPRGAAAPSPGAPSTPRSRPGRTHVLAVAVERRLVLLRCRSSATTPRSARNWANDEFSRWWACSRV